MRRVLGWLVVAVVAVTLAWWLAGLPGSASLSVGGYTVALPTALAVVVVVAFALALYGVLRLLGWLASLPRWFRQRGARRRGQAGEAARTAAMVAIAAGDPRAARRAAARARQLLGDTAEALMLAAEAERLGGDEAAASGLFRRLTERPEAALLGLRGLFRQALAREDWTEASALAGRAEAAYPGGTWLREERERLAVRTGNWRQALALASPGPASDPAARAAYAVAAAEAESDPEQGRRLARQASRDFPGFAPAAVAYARRLRAAGREERAQEVLARTWAAAPQPDMAQFALAPMIDPLQRARAAGRLVAGRPDHVESHLLLARLDLDAGLTGQARRHLDAVREAGLDERRLWLLAAELEGAENGDSETGRLAQREAWRRASSAAADPEWHCEACGTVLPGWQAACPSCHAAGRVRWGHLRQASPPPRPPTGA